LPQQLSVLAHRRARATSFQQLTGSLAKARSREEKKTKLDFLSSCQQITTACHCCWWLTSMEPLSLQFTPHLRVLVWNCLLVALVQFTWRLFVPFGTPRVAAKQTHSQLTHTHTQSLLLGAKFRNLNQCCLMRNKSLLFVLSNFSPLFDRVYLGLLLLYLLFAYYNGLRLTAAAGGSVQS